MKTLKVLAVDNAHVLQMDGSGNFILGSNQIRRHVGKIFDAELNTFVCLKEPTVLPYHVEYIRALKENSLLPADQETAALAGIQYKGK